MMQIASEIEPALVAISGGLGDIGAAIARTFRAAGAEIALADLPSKPEISSSDGFYHSLDVADSQAVERWFEKVIERFGRPPNIIIPNAATATIKPHLAITAAEWKRELDVNLNGAFYFADAGTRLLTHSELPGRVVFIGSWAGHAPHRHLPAYSVAKAGLRMLTQTLALELAAHGILVNEVAPGYVNAGLSGRIFSAQPEVAEASRNRVPIRKLLSADDVAQQVLYLCSSLADQITGTTLLLDGGLSLLQGPLFE